MNNIAKSVLRNVEQSSFTKQIAFSIMLNTSLFYKINTAFGLKVAQKCLKVLAKIAGPKLDVLLLGSQVPYESLKVINGLGYLQPVDLV